MYIIKIIIILIKTQGSCQYDFKVLGVSKLDFRQRIKELYVGFHCCTNVYNTGNPNAVLANRIIRCIYAVLATKIIRSIYLTVCSSVFMSRFGRDLNLIRDG